MRFTFGPDGLERSLGNMQMSVAVLGVAAYQRNQVWKNVEILVRSARRNSPRTHVALLTARLGDADKRQFDRFAVEAIECIDEPPTAGTTPKSREARLRWILELYGRRHALYRDIVIARDYSHVLLSDTRDVIVTAELHDRSSESLLVLSQEDVATSISAEPFNRQFFLDGYGEESLAAVATKPILCAGTVYGPSASIAEYLLAMSREVQRIGVETTRRIGDQPLHNYLAYTGMLPKYTLSSAEDGWMRSIGIQQFDNVAFDWDSGLRPQDLAVPCTIVHQYDRHLARATMRHAIGRVAGLPLLHTWRTESYRDHGKDFGARLLKKIAYLSTAFAARVTRNRPK